MAQITKLSYAYTDGLHRVRVMGDRAGLKTAIYKAHTLNGMVGKTAKFRQGLNTFDVVITDLRTIDNGPVEVKIREIKRNKPMKHWVKLQNLTGIDYDTPRLAKPGEYKIDIDAWEKDNELITCDICGRKIPDKNGWKWGNNADPAVPGGTCCDICDMEVVIPARMGQDSWFIKFRK